MKSDQKKKRKAEDVVEAYFDGSAGPMELQAIDRRVARAYLAQRLRRRYVFGEGPIYLEAFRTLGAGKEAGELARIVGDRALPVGARATASVALTAEDPRLAEKAMRTLDPADVERLADTPRRELLIAIAVGDIGSESMTVALLADAAARDGLETLRRELGVPAGLAYEDALFRAAVPDFDATMIEALATEGDAARLEDLQEARNDLPGVASALLRARNWTPAYPAATTARLSPAVIDGFAAGIVFPSGERGRFFVNAIVDRGTLREIFVDYDDGTIPDDTVHAPATPAEARAMIDSALDAFDEVTADADESSALEFLRRVSPGEVPPVPQPAPSASREDIEDLLDRPYYEPFMIPPKLLMDAKLKEPTEIPAPQSWYEESLALLAASDDVRAAVVWAAEYMARWHALRGEPREASIMARAALDAGADLGASPLLPIMLEKTLEAIKMSEEAERAESEHDHEHDHDHDEDGELDEEEYEDAVSDDAVDRVMRAVVPVVEEQIRSGTPPITKATHRRLISEGMSRKAATERIAFEMALEMADIVAAKREFSDELWEKRLRAIKPE